MISSSPILAQSDVEMAKSGRNPILTDACVKGLAVLSQKGTDKMLHPTYLASMSLSKAEKRYYSTDLEALAVVFAVRRFHMFIYSS